MPGRVNLIGEHVDYHNLPVLPMALKQHVRLAWHPIEDLLVRAHSQHYGHCEVALGQPLEPGPAGDWSNYVKAAAQAVQTRWKLRHGIDAEVTSDLPAAAGLSSSSALLTGFSIALLRANGFKAQIGQLMEILPEGEQFVGTRGGGMDHAAVLCCRRGCALLVEFAPFAVADVPIPDSWSFLVAHSLQTAEKSGKTREHYNSRRTAGNSALLKLGFEAYRWAIERYDLEELLRLANSPCLNDAEQRAFRHVVTEAGRVWQAVAALRNNDKQEFGKLLYASHASLRDDLQVSSPALDELVNQALAAGALGARLTGAGFGGCAIIFSESARRQEVADALVRNFYASRIGFEPQKHLIFAEPSAGALA